MFLKTLGAIHLGKNSESFGLESNGTVFSGMYISKILADLSRFSIFPKYRSFRKFALPFPVPFLPFREHTRLQFPSMLDLQGKMAEPAALYQSQCSVCCFTSDYLQYFWKHLCVDDEGDIAPPLGKWEKTINANSKLKKKSLFCTLDFCQFACYGLESK